MKIHRLSISGDSTDIIIGWDDQVSICTVIGEIRCFISQIEQSNESLCKECDDKQPACLNSSCI